MEEFENIFNLSPDMVGVFTTEGELIKVNPAWETILGYKIEELLEMGWTTLIHPDDVERTNKEVEEQLKGSSVVNFVNRYKCKDGSYKTLEWQATFAKDGIVHATARDITERKRAEEALRESKAKYQDLYKSAPVAYFSIGKDGLIKGANKAAEDFTGYRLEELLRMKAVTLYAEESVAKAKQLFEKFRHGIPWENEEMVYQRKDGHKVQGLLSVSPIKDESGQVLESRSVVVDITESKRAEEEIRTLAKFPSENPNPVLRVAKDGSILYANQASLPLLNVWGCQIGQPLPDHLHQSILGILSTGSPKYIEVECVEKTFSFMFSPIVDAGYVNLYGRDITERKQAEEELKESEARYRALIRLGGEVGEAVIMLVDTEEVVGLHTFASDEWSRTTGYSRKELLGMSFFDLVHPKDLAACLGRYHRRKQGESVPGLYEISIVRKDGTEVPIEITAGRTTYQGKPAAVGYIRDITERKRAEEKEKELQRELALSSRLASIGELAAGVAHEVNNPLTGIIGFPQRLLRKSTDETVSRDLERIHNEAQRAAKVIKNLLTFARRSEPKKEYSDVNDIVQKALELRAYELKTSNIEVVVELAPGIPKIMTDFGQIQEVFLNIILNAEQAMTEANSGGKLSVKTKQMKDHIKICFTDNGPGVLEEHLGKVFDPFLTTRGEKGGTGLGLSVCHGIVIEHGGKIYAKSKPGKGATFVIELPLKMGYASQGALP